MTHAENRPERMGCRKCADRLNFPLSEKSLALALRLRLGSRPASEHEGDLVHEVGQVVDNVQEAFIHRSKQVAVVVAKRVDGPTSCDNHTHVIEGILHCCRAISRHATCLTLEDLEEDVAPPCHAEEEADPCLKEASLACVTEGEHHHGAEKEPPEALGAHWLLRCLQDQIELDHLQRDCGDA